MKKRSIIIITVILIVSAILFVTVGYRYIANMPHDKLAQIVENSTVVFQEDTVSQQVLDKLAENKVVVVGEYHNIEEHEEFLYQLATSFNEKHAFSKLLIETPQAFSWVFEDYSLGIMPEVDEVTAKDFWFYVGQLENIRKYNLSLPEDKRLQVSTIDINHSPYNFIMSLEYMQEFVNEPELLLDLTTYLKDQVNHNENYINKIKAFKNDLELNSSLYKEELGDVWYSRINKMIETELVSHTCRNYLKNNQSRKRNVEREEFIKKIVDEHLKDNPNGTVINVGANHAQKTPLRGTKMEWVAEYLSTKSPYAANKTYCLFVVPAKGSIDENHRISVDLESLSHKNELLSVIAEQVGDDRGFLSFDDETFLDKRVLMNFHFETKILSPKTLYDGVIILPVGTYNNPFSKLTNK